MGGWFLVLYVALFMAGAVWLWGVGFEVQGLGRKALCSWGFWGLGFWGLGFWGSAVLGLGV